MFDSLVITLREGVEAALIVGIVLGYLKKAGRDEWTRYVWWGVGTAVAVSAAAAYFLQRWAISEDAYEGWMMLVGAVFVASVVVWMMRASKGLSKEIQNRVSDLSNQAVPLGRLGHLRIRSADGVPRRRGDGHLPGRRIIAHHGTDEPDGSRAGPGAGHRPGRGVFQRQREGQSAQVFQRHQPGASGGGGAVACFRFA